MKTNRPAGKNITVNHDNDEDMPKYKLPNRIAKQN